MKKEKKLVLFGTGAFAEVAYWYFHEDSIYEVVAFTADPEYCTTTKVLGLPLIPFDQLEQNFSYQQVEIHVAVGYNKLNQARYNAYQKTKGKGYTLASYVHSKIKIWSTNKIGDNVFVFEDNTLQPYVELGNDIVLWSGNHIGHHTVIRDHCFLTSHVVVSGFVEVGEFSFLGVNATIRDSIKIGKRNIIGAGALILGTTSDDEVYIGAKTSPIPKSSSSINKI